MKKSINNDELKKFIRKSKAQFDRAKTIEDIKNNFKEIEEFPYQFKNAVVRYIISILITIPLWIYVFYCFPRATDNSNYEYLLANYPNWLEAHPFLPAEFITEFITKFVSFHEGEYVVSTMFILIFSLIPFSIISISYLVKGLARVKKYQDYIKLKTARLLYIINRDVKDCGSEFLDKQQNKFFCLRYDLKLKNCVNIEFDSIIGKQRVSIFTLESYNKNDDTSSNEFPQKEYREGVFFPSINKIHSLMISRLDSEHHKSLVLRKPRDSRSELPKGTGLWEAIKIIHREYQREYHRSHICRETFMPASLKFKKLFKIVSADDELILAKFLEPDVVVMLEEAASKFKGFTVEFNEDGDMIICQNKLILFDVKTKNNLENPDLLLEELLSATSFPNLDYILAFANNLIKQFK